MNLRTMMSLRPIWLRTQAAARMLGFDVVYGKVTGIADADLYFPLFEPWRSSEWRKKLRTDDPHSLVSPERKYILHCHATDAIARCNGDLAECGVYKGGTARLLAEVAQQRGRKVALLDTFEGMPETDLVHDLHRKGDFSDNSLEAVRQYLSGFDNVEFYPGTIPQTLLSVGERAFCFVHIDLDIYAAIKSATEFFYTRVPSGGVIVYDDYGFPSCPGARLAVDEFFADKPEIPMVLRSGQCVVRKL